MPKEVITEAGCLPMKHMETLLVSTEEIYMQLPSLLFSHCGGINVY